MLSFHDGLGRGVGDRKALVKLKSSSALVIELHFLKQVKKSK